MLRLIDRVAGLDEDLHVLRANYLPEQMVGHVDREFMYIVHLGIQDLEVPTPVLLIETQHKSPAFRDFSRTEISSGNIIFLYEFTRSSELKILKPRKQKNSTIDSFRK